ncbi:hypothetical protein BX667DRAFT_11939 [Coemansia mojavensis]|nr:hypothetical protein BX667DRAFT_11939 [Coemansia mojavensis]
MGGALSFECQHYAYIGSFVYIPFFHHTPEQEKANCDTLNKFYALRLATYTQMKAMQAKHNPNLCSAYQRPSAWRLPIQKPKKKRMRLLAFLFQTFGPSIRSMPLRKMISLSPSMAIVSFAYANKSVIHSTSFSCCVSTNVCFSHCTIYFRARCNRNSFLGRAAKKRETESYFSNTSEPMKAKLMARYSEEIQIPSILFRPRIFVFCI